MKPETVTDYLQQFPDGKRAKLAQLRKVILSALPGCHEDLRWGAPAYLDTDGMILVMFAGFTNHMSLVVTPSAKQHFADKLEGYKTGKGSVQFTYEGQLSEELIAQIVAYRLTEYRDHGVKWM